MLFVIDELPNCENDVILRKEFEDNKTRMTVRNRAIDVVMRWNIQHDPTKYYFRRETLLGIIDHPCKPTYVGFHFSCTGLLFNNLMPVVCGKNSGSTGVQTGIFAGHLFRNPNDINDVRLADTDLDRKLGLLMDGFGNRNQTIGRRPSIGFYPELEIHGLGHRSECIKAWLENNPLIQYVSVYLGVNAVPRTNLMLVGADVNHDESPFMPPLLEFTEEKLNQRLIINHGSQCCPLP